MSDFSIEPTDLIPQPAPHPETAGQTVYSAEFAAFAARVAAKPEMVEGLFQYGLATLQVEMGLARLVRIEVRQRKPWCTYNIIGQGEVTLLRPLLNQAEEQQLLELLREIFHWEKVKDSLPAEDMMAQDAPITLETSFQPTPEEEAEAEKETETAEQALLRQDTDETAAMLQALIKQAKTATSTLQAAITQAQKVTQTVNAAINEHKLLLMEIRSTMRRHERIQQEFQRLQNRAKPEGAKAPSNQRRLVSDRDKQLTLSILKGTNLTEAGQIFGLSSSRIKQIYTVQLRRLYRASERLELTKEDLAVIRSLVQPVFSGGKRPDTGRIAEFLEKMWADEEL